MLVKSTSIYLYRAVDSQNFFYHSRNGRTAINPNDPYGQNTMPERYPQFLTNPDQDLQNSPQISQDEPYYPLSSFPQYDRKYDWRSDVPYGSHYSRLPISQYSSPFQWQPPQGLWQWYLGHNKKERLAIACSVLVILLLLGGIFGAFASAGGSVQHTQTAAVPATQMAVDQVPTSTPIPAASLIPNPTATLTPSPTPTPAPSPTPTPLLTPKPIEKVNVTVSSQMVKKIDGDYRYLFDILNNDSESFEGGVTISLYNDRQQTPLGQKTFSITQPLQPGVGSVVYFDITTGPISQQSGSGITHFTYAIIVDGQVVNTGAEQITNQYEDTSLF